MRNYILTITPNPALDLSGVVENLVPNEKSYVHDEIRSPGGNAINTARILRRFGVPALAAGFLGGSIGQEIKHLLDEEGVKNKFVQIKGHSRICVTVSNKENHYQTRLTFPGPHISKNEKIRLFELFQNSKKPSYLVIGGSLPAGFQTSDILRLMNFARKMNIECVVDCPGKIMSQLIAGKPLLIKPNLTEFQEMTRTNVKSINAVKKEAHKLLDRVANICISSVENGTLLVTRNASYFGDIAKVKVISSVGAGDSMVGAMVAQFYKENTSEADILRWGLAGAAATLARPGTAFGSASEIHRLYKKTKVRLLL